MKKNKKLLNKVKQIEVLGEGSKGDFFGKIDKVVCFISDSKGSNLPVGELVDVKITNVTESCVFAELIKDDFNL